MKYDSITEQSIGMLIERFYGKVRIDAALAPIFEKALAGHWDAHIAKMREFWCAALRVKRSYHGDMLVAHQKLGKLPRSLFPRWLALFRETVDECFLEAPAIIICDRALKTARNLESALTHNGANSAPHVQLTNLDRPGLSQEAGVSRMTRPHVKRAIHSSQPEPQVGHGKYA